MSNWISLDTTKFIPPGLFQMVDTIDNVTKIVNQIMELTAAIADKVDMLAMVIDNPSSFAALTGIKALRAAVQGFLLPSSGSVHFIHIPIYRPPTMAVRPIVPLTGSQAIKLPDVSMLLGNGGNLGFYNTLQQSTVDPKDIARPQFGQQEFVTGLVLLAGSNQFNIVADMLAALGLATGGLATGATSNSVPCPQDLVAHVWPTPAVNLTWNPIIPVGKAAYGISAYLVKKVNIYRSEKPFSFSDPQEKLNGYKISSQDWNPTNGFFIDNTVEPGKTYYYAVGYKVGIYDASGGEVIIKNDAMSSVVRAFTGTGKTRMITSVDFGKGTPPDWVRMRAAMDLFPIVRDLLNLIDSYLLSMQLGLQRAGGALRQLATTLRMIVNSRVIMIQQLVQLIKDIRAFILPLAGLYVLPFAGVGGNPYFLRTVFQGLSPSNRDPARPPFDTGKEFVGGAVLLAGGTGPAQVAGVVQLVQWFQGARVNPVVNTAPPITINPGAGTSTNIGRNLQPSSTTSGGAGQTDFREPQLPLCPDSPLTKEK